MKLDKYKKYRKYNLMMIPFTVLFYSLSEEKNDIFYFIGVSLIFVVMAIGAWLEILIKKENNFLITFRDRVHLMFPLIVGIPYIIMLFMKL